MSPTDEAPTPSPSPPAPPTIRTEPGVSPVALTGVEVTARSDTADFLAPAQAAGELGRLGPYRVLKVLGSGGMGVVFEAEDIQLKRRTALKAMKPALAAADSARARFVREARLAAALKHDHVVTIYQVGEDRGVPFLAMEYLEGESLDDRLKRAGKLSAAETARIGCDVAEGLAAAHAAGLIHRDIKPGNIWLESRGRVKILDFGLARAADSDDAHLTASGAIMGTPAYMAPEQTRGEKADFRCDLFSLGSLLYRCCTGVVPFPGADSIAILVAVSTQQPKPPCEVNPQVPAVLSDLVMRLLEKDRDKRPASAREVAEVLRPLFSEPTVMLPPVAPALPVGPRPRNPWRAASAVLALLLAATGLALVLALTSRDRPAALTPTLPDGRGSSQPEAGPPPNPMDALRREDIPPGELAAAGDGDPARAPARLVAVLGESRLAQWEQVKTVAFRPDGKVLASCGGSLKVYQWDSANGALLKALVTDGPAHVVAYTPDGRKLLFGNAGILVVCAAETGKRLSAWDTHHEAILALAIDAEGKLLATGGSDFRVRLWNAETGQDLHLLSGHAKAITALAFRKGGKMLASAGADGKVILWDATTGKALRTITTDGPERNLLAFSPDGKALVHAVTEMGRIRLRVTDPDTGDVAAKLEADAPQTLAFSPDGKYLVGVVTELPDEIRRWETNGWKQVPAFRQPGVSLEALAFSLDGKTLATGNLAGLIQLWDWDTLKEKLPSGSGLNRGQRGLDFSPDSQLLAVSNAEGTMQLWTTATARKLKALKRTDSASIGVLKFLRDGKTIVTGQNGAYVVWDVPSGEERVHTAGFPGNVLGMALSPDEKTVAFACQDAVRILETSTGKELRHWGGKDYFTTVAYRPDGKVLACVDVEAVTFRDAENGQLLRHLPVDGLRSVAWRNDGQLLAFTDKYASHFQVWEANLEAEQFARTELAYWAFFLSSRNALLTVGQDGAIHLWDYSRLPIRKHSLCPTFGKLAAVALSSDQRYLVTANGNGTVYIFRLDPLPSSP